MGRWFPDWEYGEDIAERDRLTAQGVAREKLLVRAWEGELRPLPTAHDEAVKILLSMAISACKRRKKYVGICGQGPSDHPELAHWLQEQGIESMSLNPDTVVETWMFLAQQKVEL